MQHPLRLHPDSACDAVRAASVEVARPAAGRLGLTFRITRGAGLVIPPPAEPLRTDELWKHTCFEAFLKSPGDEAYLELNLSPSGQWAAYAFDGYRAGMRPADIPAPRTRWRDTADGFELTAEIAGLPLPADAWSAGLAAVIEETSGRTSYWALAHPAGRADFHHHDGFALTLPGPTPA